MGLVFSSNTVIDASWEWPGVIPTHVATKLSSGPSVCNNSYEPEKYVILILILKGLRAFSA